MGEFASKGVAGAGLGTGIAGLSLGALNALGWLGTNKGYLGNGAISQQDLISQQGSEIAFYRAKSYSDETGLEMYKYIDGRLRTLEERMHQNELAQTAFNSTTTASLNTLSAQLNDAKATLAAITKTAVPQSAVCNFDNHSTCGLSTT